MVSFVGAGPGAVDLITLKGAELLKKADIIIYAGSLVNPELLASADESCEIYNSAKMSLDEVIDVMTEGNSAGKNIVRLHTGDPAIFGAIREQMDRLDVLNIPYEVIPGVSSLFGAAAALKAEYTLPGISQSVIVTRMEGRTAVPSGERLSALAAHQATMVIFLSASMTDLVQEELIAGGYSEDTPAAIVYKATWSNEKVFRCTVGTLHECATKNNIKNLALITVGRFLGDEYELSKLYDSSFSTGFRSATGNEKIKVSIISFTDKGEVLAKKIAGGINEISDVCDISDRKCKKEDCYSSEQGVCNKFGYESKSEKISGEDNASIYEVTNVYRCEDGGLNSWTAKRFRCDDALIFVGACGIATRAIAPYIVGKTVDPAVIVVDELGKNVIPILSGHIGGANRLSGIISDFLGANSVITTATDINDVPAIDVIAKDMGLSIVNPAAIKSVAKKLLLGERVVIDGDVPEVCAELAERLELTDEAYPDGASKGADRRPIDADNKNIFIFDTASSAENVHIDDGGGSNIVSVNPDIFVTYRKTGEAAGSGNCKALVLVPRILSVGVGCKKETSVSKITALWDEISKEYGLYSFAVKNVASIDIKANEKGIIDFAEGLGVSFLTYSASKLEEVEGDFAESEFVKSVTGVDNVCERSAVAAGGKLIIRKHSKDGVTMAVAIIS